MGIESNFGGYVRDELERMVSPTTTMSDLWAQLARATAIDQERLVQMGNGVVTLLDDEQIYRIARTIRANPDVLLRIYNNDLRALRGEYQPAAPANPQTPTMTFAEQIRLSYAQIAQASVGGEFTRQIR